MRPELREVFKLGWFIKFIAFGAIITGLFWAAGAAYDQQRGIASVRPPFGGAGTRPAIAVQAKEPRVYRNLMLYEWFRVGGALFVGFTILGMLRRQDQLDPFSTSFAGRKELDALDLR